MKLTLKEIYDSQPSMRKLLMIDFPIKTAFKLSRMSRKIGEIFQDLEAQRVKLVEKYGEESENGSTVKAENIEKFQEELNELLQEEEDLGIEPIPLEELADAKLSALDMMTLAPFLKE